MPASSPSTPLTLLECLHKSRPGTTELNAAWTRFVHLYAPLLHEWARRRGMQDADCADVTQDVFVKLRVELPNYERKDGRTFCAWLRTIVNHQCEDFRSRKATRKGPPADGLSAVAGPDHDPFVENEENEHRLFLVHRALEIIRKEFDPKQSLAFSEHKVKGRPAAEVAAELGLTPANVYVICHRVLRRLREEVGGFVE